MGVKKSTKDWNKINFNDLEKQWEEGDEDEEREYEFEHSEKIMKRKAREAKEEKAKAKKVAAKNKKKESKPSSKPSKGKSGGGKGRKSAGPTEGDGDWVPPPPGFENIDMSQTIGPGGRGGPGGPGGGMPPGLEGFDMKHGYWGHGVDREGHGTSDVVRGHLHAAGTGPRQRQ